MSHYTNVKLTCSKCEKTHFKECDIDIPGFLESLVIDPTGTCENCLELHDLDKEVLKLFLEHGVLSSVDVSNILKVKLSRIINSMVYLVSSRVIFQNGFYEEMKKKQLKDDGC